MKTVFTLYREVLSVLPDGARRFLTLYSSLLASFSVLDAAALGLLALVIGPLSIGGEVSLPVIGVLDSWGVLWAILTICALMITKGLLSVATMWWGTRRIARYEVLVGDRLFRGYLRAPWLERLSRNSSDVLRFTDGGVDATVNSFIRPGATLPGELVSLVLIVATLAIVQPLIALVTLVYLLLLGAVLYLWIAKHSRRAGEVNLNAALRTARLVLESMASLKEVTIRGREQHVADAVEASRKRSARARGNMYFLGQVPRYVLESGLIGGFLVVGGAGLLIGGQEVALTGVALFGLAGFRMAPAVIRFQSVVSQMLAASPYVKKVIEEIEAAESTARPNDERPGRELTGNIERIVVDDVSFRYAPEATPAVDHVSLEIPIGSFVAFVGTSGSGKSTMVDLLLGLLDPTDGSVRIDDENVADVRRSWRSRVAYVPQDVAMFDATIAQNVALSWTDDYDAARVRAVLAQAQLLDIVDARAGGIEGAVGERGLALSGGQRQRLGIARALYSDPQVLVMDEATSALDTQTEAAVTASIAAIGKERTVIVVAHRLATVMSADRIFVMSEGRLLGSGTFDELIASVPQFAHQAQLAGLSGGALPA